MKADLHTHSLISDGTDTPAELVQIAHQAGINTLALTDHDTMAGWEEAQNEAAKCGITFIPGIEVTSRLGNKSVHVLAYLPDPEHEELHEVLTKMKNSRLHRARKIVSNLEKDFPDLNWDYIESLYGEQINHGKSLGKPLIADAMIQRGYFPDRTAAFKKVLHSNSPYVIPQEAMTPLAAVKLIRKAHGVPVVAHSRSIERGEEVPFSYLEQLVDAGMLGIEKDHREHNQEQRMLLEKFAQKHHLIVTGSSDYHGKGKPNLIGENTTSEENIRRILSYQK
ncbi:MAG: PHP domain-containing protein [Micrococcaceae bacterium]